MIVLVVVTVMMVVVVMTVTVAIIVARVMVMVVVMRMIVMMMAVIARGRGIGATLRFERSVERDDLRAQALQQRLDRRIAFEPQPALQHLDRHMPVAEVPGKPRQRRKIRRAHLDQWFGLGHDLNESAVVEHQRVVGAQPHSFDKIELDAGAFNAEHETLLRQPLRIRKDQRIDGGRIQPFGSVNNTSGAWHIDPIRWR